MPFEVIIGQNSRTDCTRDSVKTSLGSENSIRSSEFEKGIFAFEIFRKMQIIDFPEAIFDKFSKNPKNILHASLLAFSKRFLAWTTTKNRN